MNKKENLFTTTLRLNLNNAQDIPKPRMMKPICCMNGFLKKDMHNAADKK